ncbi:hypothetical protein B0H13DRAFT_1905357 [Mycena leptocephala]|nr:hypothetical protein B0H13DRAFT_1905357 [Mycena leptocephala]
MSASLQCKNYDYVVPVKWIVYENAIHAEAYAVIRETSGTFTIEDHTIIQIFGMQWSHIVLIQSEFDALSADCKGDEWTTAYDCELRQEMLFKIHAHLLPADVLNRPNPPQLRDHVQHSGVGQTTVVFSLAPGDR